MARGGSRPSGTRIHRRLFRPDGLYAFGRQPEAIHWDLAQLAGCLTLIGEAPACPTCSAAWPAGSRRRWSPACCVGSASSQRGEAEDRRSWPRPRSQALRSARRIDRFFFDWRGGRDPAPSDTRRELPTLAPALEGRQRAIPSYTGPTPNPARCISRRSRRSGRRSRKSTTGSRSRTKSRRSAEWATPWTTGCTQLDRRTATWCRRQARLMTETLVSTEPATGARSGPATCRRCRRRGRGRARRLAGMGGAFGHLSDRGAAPLRQCRRAAKEPSSPS